MEDYRVVMLNDDTIPPGENGWPYQVPKLNDGYAQFFARARRRNLPVLLANDSDYVDGMVRRGWSHDGHQFVGLRDVPVAAVYDQFPSSSPEGRTLVGEIEDRGLTVFNNPRLTTIVDDKLLSYINFPDIIPPTTYFQAGRDDPRLALERFVESCHQSGFGDIESFVAKEQTGWGARNLYKFTQENLGELYHLPHGEFVFQPFLESSGGIPEIGVHRRHDLRLILENGRFVTAMVRQPARHDWAANYFNPEELIFVHRLEDLPNDIVDAVLAADKKFESFYPRLISYDMARLTDGRVACWEMNSRPGMTADSNRPDDQLSAGELQEAILNCLEIVVGRR